MSKSRSQVDGLSPSKYSQASISPAKIPDEAVGGSEAKPERGAATEVGRQSISRIEVPASDLNSDKSEQSLHEIDMITQFK